MLSRLLCLLCLTAGLAAPARAADPFAPALVVNDRLVTHFDIEQRQRFMIMMGASTPANGREKAIQSLIDDKLRAEAAKSVGVALSEAQVKAAMEEFAGQFKLKPDALFGQFGKNGVTKQAVLDLVENQAAFREAVRVRYLAQAMPSEAEIAAESSRPGGTLQTRMRLAELVLPVAERGEAKTNALAEELYQSLSGGGDFVAAVRSYSRTASAKKNGEVGFMPLDRLPTAVSTELATLSAGQVTRPITMPGVVVLLKVLEVAEDSPAEIAAEGTVTYVRLVVPLKARATEAEVSAAASELSRVGQGLSSCADAEKRKDTYARGSGKQGPTAPSQLSEDERAALAPLAPGQASQPVRAAGAMALLFLCERTAGGTTASDPSALEAARTRLLNERMASYAAGLLQEMRRDAVIEYR